MKNNFPAPIPACSGPHSCTQNVCSGPHSCTVSGPHMGNIFYILGRYAE